MDINYLAIDSQVCFHGQLFANPVKPSWCIIGPVQLVLPSGPTVGPLGSTNQNWLCAKLLPMVVSIYSVVCVHSCHLLGTQNYCLWSNGKEGLPLACPPTPTTPTPFPLTHSLISVICDITGVVKNYLKNQQWTLHSRSSYETVAISPLYLYSKSCVAASSMFQNGISRNIKCDIMVGFPKSSHIYALC